MFSLFQMSSTLKFPADLLADPTRIRHAAFSCVRNELSVAELAGDPRHGPERGSRPIFPNCVRLDW